VGRRCSRGRLHEGVRAGGVDVHDGGHPQLRLLTPSWLAFLSGAARRRRVPFLFSSGARRGEGGEKTPMGLVASQPGLVFLVVLKRGGAQRGVICPQCPRAVPWLVRPSRRARPARSDVADAAVGKSEGDWIGKERLTGWPHSPVKGRIEEERRGLGGPRLCWAGPAGVRREKENGPKPA
jgi:hypothetical protein